ncbi:MAG: ice-binding family protein [Patescibacteria group bacterium]|jgi:uncharacterized repeat protein (TIGR01451 family)
MIAKLFFKLRYVPALLFALILVPAAHAATNPDLGTAATYSILAGSSVTNSGNTTISGDVGISPGAALPPNVTGWPSVTLGGTLYDTGGTALTAMNNKDTAFGTLAVPACGADGGVDYGGVTHELAGDILVPGVYCANSFHLTNGTLTLNGSATDVWIFRSASDLVITGATSQVIFTGGGLPCNVWWRVVSSASLAVDSAFVGSILAATSITFGTGATLNGRALAGTGLVSLLGNTISGPSCTAAVIPPGASNTPPLINVKKVPTPLSLPNGPGSVTYNYTVRNLGILTMTEVTLVDDKCPNMKFISGDLNKNSQFETTEVWYYSCTTTLNETTVNFATARGNANGMATVDTAIAEVFVGVPVIPPLIHIVKTPSPLVLPSGGGAVAYGYTVTNPGTVALTNVTVTDNKCSSLKYVSGDTNGDSKLQSTETWKYTCSANISLTTTNTAIATGHANGLTAIDTALATVVVEGSPVPPLIHIIKKADPIVLPAKGGLVAYTYAVMNPGTVALNNVTVTDDKCGTVALVSGDTNVNALMEPNETWTYACQQNLKATTTNTATATGHANGLTVTDVSMANVVLSPALLPAAPKLPNTGFEPGNSMLGWMVAAAGIFVAASILLVLTKRKSLF